MKKLVFAALVAMVAPAGVAHAQDGDGGASTWRYRVTLGPAVGPRYPGADHVSLRPMLGATRVREGNVFPFSAPDQGASIAFVNASGFSFGPSANLQGRRRARDVGANVPTVGWTPEIGGFVQAVASPNFRLRAEARQGIGGHKGLIGIVSADFVARDADRWLFSVGPRLTITNGRYQRAYFGVTSATALATGIPAYSTNGGLQAVGGATSVLRQLTPSIGVTAFAKYDRLIDDPSRSPLVTRFGSRNQISGGLGLSYTFSH